MIVIIIPVIVIVAIIITAESIAIRILHASWRLDWKIPTVVSPETQL